MHDDNQGKHDRDLPVPTGESTDDRELGNAWRDVGEQFQQLGTKLADAIREGWRSRSSDEESEAAMRRLRDDLRAAADRVDSVIRQAKDETAEERRATFEATRKAGSQSLDEARVLTASTLRKLNQQLDRLVQRLETQEGRSAPDEASADESGEGEDEGNDRNQ